MHARVATVVGLLVFSTSPAFAENRGADYTPLVELPPVADELGDDASDATDINERGFVVGTSSGPNASRAVYWDRSGKVFVVPSGVRGQAINDRNQMVGIGPGHGFVFDIDDGSLVLLPPLESGGGSSARAINDRGRIAGTASHTSEVGRRPRAVVWTSSSATPTLLPTLPGGTTSLAYAINNEDELTGYSSRADDGVIFPVVWLKGKKGYTVVELGNDGGSPDGLSEYGRGLNDLTEIAGVSGFNPTLWELDGKRQRMIQLKSARNLGPEGVANDVNNHGEVVGYLGINGAEAPDQPQGVLWTKARKKPSFLGSFPGGSSSFPRAINDDGVIVGLADLATGEGRAFITWPDCRRF